MSKNKAFTLAEVLVTLVVIGVVAALVIPSLAQKIQDSTYKAAWKSTFSDLNQATSKLLTDNGSDLKQLCGADDTNCLRDKYKAYLNYIKSCDQGSAFGSCWHLNGSFYELSGGPASWGDTASLILANGSMVTFWYPSNGNVPSGDSRTCDAADTDGPILSCGYIYIDVNVATG